PAMSSTPLPATTSPETNPAPLGPAGAIRLPAAPALLAGVGRAVWIDPDEGELVSLPADEAARRARTRPPLVCHARATAQRLGIDPFPAFDLLELFAFVRPASFCAPTPHCLAAALGLPKPTDAEGAAMLLPGLARALLAELAARGDRDAPGV